MDAWLALEWLRFAQCTSPLISPWRAFPTIVPEHTQSEEDTCKHFQTICKFQGQLSLQLFVTKKKSSGISGVWLKATQHRFPTASQRNVVFFCSANTGLGRQTQEVAITSPSRGWFAPCLFQPLVYACVSLYECATKLKGTLGSVREHKWFTSCLWKDAS